MLRCHHCNCQSEANFGQASQSLPPQRGRGWCTQLSADRRCSKCGHLIGKGVRFNAEKKAIGAYFSTKIWAFTMRAPCCQNRIEIHTDPKNARYIIVEGAREKVCALGRGRPALRLACPA